MSPTRRFLKRLTILFVFWMFATVFHAASTVNTGILIKAFAPAYQPMSDEQRLQELRTLKERYPTAYAAASLAQIEQDRIARYYFPMEEKLRDSLHTAFGAIHATLFFVLAVILLKWLSAVFPSALRAFSRKASTLGSSASDALNVQSILDRARIKSAETDYMRIKNLHDNGLISDDVFEERKAALIKRINK